MKEAVDKNEVSSIKQNNFVKKYKRELIINRTIRYLIAIIFILQWEITARLKIIDSFFFSSPSRIINQIISMVKDNDFFQHLSITLLEIIISFSVVTLISITFAVLMWCIPRLSTILEPYLIIFNSLPKSALAPLFIVWLGTGLKTIIVAGASVALFGSIINIYSGFCNCDESMLELITTLGGNKKDKLIKVVLPYSLPVLLSTSKVNIGLSLVGVVIGEFLSSKNGLGYLIIYGTQVFQLDLVITSIIILCFIAIILYFFLEKIEKSLQR